MRRRHRVLYVSLLGRVLVKHTLTAILLFLAHPLHAQDHPYVRFEKNFNRMMDKYDWGHHDKGSRKLLCRAIWDGSKKNYKVAAYAAGIGCMESHYTREERGISYEKTRGYLGTHNGTLIAELRRLHLSKGRDRARVLKDLERYPIYATWLGASRWSYICEFYGFRVGLYQWVWGEAWRTNAKKRKLCHEYADGVEYIYRKYYKE